MLDGARVLMTGATRRLGGPVAAELVAAGSDLVLIVRATSPRAARERARAALGTGVDLRHVTVFCGDVTQAALGLRSRERARLRASIDLVLHAAAATTFTSSLESARVANVLATANVLAFAERLPRLLRFAHVSTAFVAGKRVGRVLERDLEHGSAFHNGYQLPAVPGTPATPVDLVTAGDVARAVARLLGARGASGAYHVAGGHRAPALSTVVGRFGVRFVHEQQFAWEISKWRREKPRLRPVYDELESFIYDLAYAKIFDTSRVEAALGGPVVVEDPVASLFREDPAAARRRRLGAIRG